MRPEHYDAHFKLEQTHWWFTGRRAIVLSLLDREVRGDPQLQRPLRVLDVGCGGGGILPYLSKYGSVVAVDPEPAAVAAASSRSFDVRLGGLPSDLPFGTDDKFDIITMLDVLEHVDADTDSLLNIRSLLQPHGRLLITVPAYQFLWSGHDVINDHKRRYHRAELTRKLETAGFHINLMSYCNSALFLPIAAIRLAMRRFGRSDAHKTALGIVPAPANAVLHSLFAMERYIIPTLPLPFGVSLITVASVKEKNAGKRA
jgi:SAM-dependent methyltransferase